jgi:hypothetical protein
MELIFIIVVGFLWWSFTDSSTSSSNSSSNNNYQNKDVSTPHVSSMPRTSSVQPKATSIPKKQTPHVAKATVPRGQSEADRKAIIDSQLKQNYQKYLNYLRQNGVQYLYHFTDRSNIESIKRVGGLISWEEANRRGLTIPRPGGDTLSRQLDSRKNLGNYVRLCFHPDHPMKFVARTQGRMPNPVILKIKLPVAALKNTLYSNVNATASYAQIGGDYASLQRINFDVINSGTWVDETQKHQFQAEVMVHRFVNIANIINIG